MALLDWFPNHARDLPWRRTRDPYAIWVSEIMLQQTQVKTVIPYWECWMRELPTIQATADASPAKLHKLWEGLGYYIRVRNLQKAAQQIVLRHHGKFPENFDEIINLPGIGRYTAGAIASIAFHQARPILDGNVIRVLTRVFGIKRNPREAKSNAQLWQLASELVTHARAAKVPGQNPMQSSQPLPDDNSCSHFNQSLMELGALICTPKDPKCKACPVRNLCVAYHRNWQNSLPNFTKRTTSTARHFVAFVVERHGTFLVRQRPAGVVNGHLWEFPNLEIGAKPSEPRSIPSAARALHLIPVDTKPFCVIKHSITRYRITLEACRANLANTHAQPAGQWLALPHLHKLAFASAHKKILTKL